MANTLVEYNGYIFNDYSHVTYKADMAYDDADRTVLYHRGRLRVESIITAESGEYNAGQHFRRIRQTLSKAGGILKINHEGFGPTLNINGLSQDVRDVAFGPKPRLLEWNPVGSTNAVEVVWECEFCLPTCEGLGGVRFTGPSTINYSISYKIDRMGYTTRVITGYIEIAMTRFANRQIPDTADAYRDRIAVPCPENFHRETDWNLSLDKRRLDFTITDSEIITPNAYPPGVIEIDGNHRVGWSRRHMATLPNSISARIVLAHGQPRSRAWEIFRALVLSRFAYAGPGRTWFLESLEVDEELYGRGAITFQLGYKILFGYESGGEALIEIFSSTGMFQPTPGDWFYWAQEARQVQSQRGRANMANNPSEDQILDLCTDTILPWNPTPTNIPVQPPSPAPRLCNPRPAPAKSYIRFEGSISTIEDNPSTEQITMGKDDLSLGDFDPNDPTGGIGQTVASERIERFIESAAAGIEFVWEGYAERVGYDIPKPGKLQFGGVTLIRKGKGEFRKRFIGRFFCQPVYAAGWRFRYVVDTRPQNLPATDADPVNEPGAGGAAGPIIPGAS